MDSDAILVRALSESAQPLGDTAADLNSIVEAIGQARCVLIGEATHGTHELYRLRARLTQKLIEEQCFSAVAAEADWPDAWRVNRYLHGIGSDSNATEALGDFQRFPAWMWRNTDVVEFIDWLHAHNRGLDSPRQVGFYGLDLYSLHASIGAVLGYLDKTDPDSAKRARQRYSCFDQFGEDPHLYGQAGSFGMTADCEREVVEQLLELQRRQSSPVSRDGLGAEDARFAAEQNARVVMNAEQYYRSMFKGRDISWNLRDTHMADTLDALFEHLSRRQGRGPAKVVVWAHNSHVGDARATSMGARGEVNIGQLARQRYPGQTYSIGFSTHSGTVTAASDWGEPAERKRVRPALAGSCEDLLHRVASGNFWLDLRQLGEAGGALREPRLQRAIGVLYLPQTERQSHYFRTRLPDQFDAMLHLDVTRALHPLERTGGWEKGEAPETFPVGL